MRTRRVMTVVAATGALALISGGMAFAAGHPAAGTAKKTHTMAFSSSGQGTEQSLSPSGCQFTAQGCIVRASGTAAAAHLGHGPFTTTLTIDWAANYSNGKGGSCAPATGPSVLTTSRGQLDLQNTGTICEIGPTGVIVHHVFFGTFTITGGTGRLATASGSGSVYGGDDGVGNFGYTAFGTITD